MPSQTPSTPLSLLVSPYTALKDIAGGKAQLKAEGRHPGSLLLWQLADGIRSQDIPVVRDRPGGLPLIVVLPAPSDFPPEGTLSRLMSLCRPQGILPYHDTVSVEELVWVLTRPPEDLPVEVTEYLVWRGIRIDRETARLIRKTVELSTDLRSISSLARSLYLSRRALGRRFLSRGLPVPSHWLHFARLLRVAIRLQNSGESIVSVGFELGYSDGFSLSNQMMRLIGFRPSDVRAYLGWEWILEAWLRREAETGGLAPEYTREILSEPVPELSAEEMKARRELTNGRRGRGHIARRRIAG
jgi:AraC-like DNA-binding protein